MIETLKEIWAYRSMIRSLVHKDLRGRYQASVLGFLWTFIVPLCQLAVYSLMFSIIMRGAAVEKFYLYVFVALIPWNFFSACLTGGASSVVAQQSLVNKIYFPREVVPISYVTSSFVNMLLCEIIVIAVSIFSGVPFNVLGYLCLPLVMLVEYLFALGITMIISAIDVYFRDLEHILGVVAMAWMFVTPIMYDSSIVADSRWFALYKLNPMYIIVTAYRDILYAGKVPQLKELAIMLGISIVLLWLGFRIFGRLKRRFSEVM